MKKVMAIFLSVLLVLFAGLYYTRKGAEERVASAEITVSQPEKNMVMASRFQNILNNVIKGQIKDEYASYEYTVENITQNADGSYSVLCAIQGQSLKAISTFKVSDESNTGYSLVFFDIIEQGQMISI